MVAGPDLRQQVVVNRPARAAQRRDREAVVLGVPGDDRVCGHREAPHLLRPLLVVAAPDAALAGVGQLPAPRAP
jgi:hypothetical protein